MNSRNQLGVYVAVGVGVGAALGSAFHNIPVWLGAGAAVGVALGLTFGASPRGRNFSHRDK